MRRILTIILMIVATLSVSVQSVNAAVKHRQKATKTNKTKSKSSQKTTTYKTAAIKNLQSQRAAIQQKIKQQEKALKANQDDVKKRLQNLMVINSEIDDRKKSIFGIQQDITHINGSIGILQSQLQTLEQQLTDRKEKYIKSLHYMTRHRTIQDELMFIFSAKSFTQMYRRLRFVREYAAYQRAQGEMLKAKEDEIYAKNKQLQRVKGNKNVLLYKNQQAHVALQNKQGEQQNEVKGLQHQQKNIQIIIAQQRQKDAALNAQIDRMVEEEMAKARARAAVEAQRKADAIARAKAIAQKKAAAEAAARENARRVAEAKAREEKLKADARAAAQAAERAKREATAAAARDAADRQARADQAAREAESNRQAAERKAKADEKRNTKAIADAKQEASDASTMSSVDRMMNGGFEANRGRLPMPITGGYRIVSHFGQYNVEGLTGVTLDNKGINILGQPGSAARSIYDGEVSAVFGFGGTMVVMVRHGVYISVYCNLKSVSVHRGQKVSTRQVLGYVGTDNILQFQLRRGTAKLNPEAWLGR